jgi:heme exporter protein A
LIEARTLRKAFGPSLVLRDVDLDVGRGEVVAVLGPNGAGKSTLLRILACISRASAGRLSLFGADCHPGRPTRDVLARIGFLGHEPLLYEDLTPRQNLEFFARLYPARDGSDARDPSLSRGMLQRLAIARATLHAPELLLLDEPFTALDEAGCDLLGAEIERLAAAGTSVVMVTHDLARVAALAGRIVVLAGGRVVGDAAPVPAPGDLARTYRRLTGVEA